MFSRFFYRLREAFTRFMYGRYGMDSLNLFLLVVYFVLSLFNMIFVRIEGRGIAYFIIYIIQTALFLWILFRMLSRNIYSRQKENNKFLLLKGNLKSRTNKIKMRWQYRKTHVFRNCPNCKATIKLPRKKGNHTVTCPKCRSDFKVKI